MLKIAVPVFDLGGSYGNFRFGKSPEMSGEGLEKVWKFIFKLHKNLYDAMMRVTRPYLSYIF